MNPNTQSETKWIQAIVQNTEWSVQEKLSEVKTNSAQGAYSSNLSTMLQYAAVANNIELIPAVLRKLRTVLEDSMFIRELGNPQLSLGEIRNMRRASIKELDERINTIAENTSLQPPMRAFLKCAYAERFGSDQSLDCGLLEFGQLGREDKNTFIEYAINSQAFLTVANLASAKREDESGTSSLLNFDELSDNLKGPFLRSVAGSGSLKAIETIIPDSEEGANRLKLLQKSTLPIDAANSRNNDSIKYLLDMMQKHNIQFHPPVWENQLPVVTNHFGEKLVQAAMKTPKENDTVDAILKYAHENQITLSPEHRSAALYWAVRSHNTEAAQSLINAQAPIHLTTMITAFLTFKFDIGVLLFQARYPAGQKNGPSAQIDDAFDRNPQNRAQPSNDVSRNSATKQIFMPNRTQKRTLSDVNVVVTENTRKTNSSLK